MAMIRMGTGTGTGMGMGMGMTAAATSVRALALVTASALSHAVLRDTRGPARPALAQAARLLPVFAAPVLLADPWSWIILLVPAAAVVTRIRSEAAADASASNMVTGFPADGGADPDGDALAALVVAGPLPEPLANAQGIPSSRRSLRAAGAADGAMGEVPKVN